MLLCKGVESLETERKGPGGHSPRPAAPRGTRGARLQVRVHGGLTSGLLPLLAPAVSAVCSPQVLPQIHFLLCFSIFIFHFSGPYLCLFPLLFVSFSVWKESCPGKPPPSSFGGKDWPQETNPSSCLLETSRLIFPSQEQNTKGCWPHQWISRRSVRSYCSFLSIQCGLLQELLLTFP